MSQPAWANLTAVLCELAQQAEQGVSKRLLILPHISADADAIASALALKAVCAKLALPTVISLEEACPPALHFLGGSQELSVFDPAAELSTYDLVIQIDCHEAQRLGKRQVLLARAAQHFVIDHHLNAQEGVDTICSEPWRSSTGEMVFYFVRAWEERLQRELLSQESAFCLATAIYADTGGLRFSNVGRQTVAAIYELLAYGISLATISEQLFNQVSLGQRRLEAVAYQRAQWLAAGSLAISYVLSNELEQCQAVEDDLRGLCHSLRLVAGTELAIFIYFAPAEGVNPAGEAELVAKLNFRSQAYADCAALASTWGGGGHKRAAGARVKLAVAAQAEFLAQLTQAAEQQLKIDAGKFNEQS